MRGASSSGLQLITHHSSLFTFHFRMALYTTALDKAGYCLYVLTDLWNACDIFMRGRKINPSSRLRKAHECKSAPHNAGCRSAPKSCPMAAFTFASGRRAAAAFRFV